MDALIVSGEEAILISDLGSFPQFIRFNEVELRLGEFGVPPMRSMSIAEKCVLFRKHLHDLKLALNDSNSIVFQCLINRDHGHHFNSPYQLIDHLRDEFLPNCANSRCYKFYICFGSDENENAATDMIASIIQLAQISRCQNVEIEIDGFFSQQTQLPVGAISSWLAGMYENGVKICDQKKRKLLLTIYLGAISNTKEMLDYLEEVSLFYLILLRRCNFLSIL